MVGVQLHVKNKTCMRVMVAAFPLYNSNAVAEEKGRKDEKKKEKKEKKTDGTPRIC